MDHSSNPGHSYLDQRRSPRRTLETQCGLLHRGVFHLSFVRQVGEGGALVASSLPLEVGDRVVITLAIPGGGLFSSRLEILYDQGLVEGTELRKFGAKFVDLPLKAKRWIRGYVAAKTEKEAEADLSKAS